MNQLPDPNTPIAAPPPGVIPNYVNPESRGWETILTVTICLTLMFPFFALRLYSRAFVTRSLGWDDYTCAIGVVGAVAFAGVFTEMLNYGYQTHLWNLTVGKVEASLKYLLVYTVLYGPTVFFIKISILILYQRLFSLERWMKILIYLGMAYIFLANAIATILFGALCAPRNGEPYIIRYQQPVCVDNVNNLGLATSVVNLISDVYLLALPLPLVLKLQLSNKRKTGLVAIFMTGILACVSSLTSIIVRAKWGHNPDYSWWSPRLVFTSIIEMNVGIICACMPACAAVFRGPWQFPNTVRSWFSRSGSRSSSKGSLVKESKDSPSSSKKGDFHPRESYIELGEAQAQRNGDLDFHTSQGHSWARTESV